MVDRDERLHQEILEAYPHNEIPRIRDLNFRKGDDELGFLLDRHGFPRRYNEVSAKEYHLGGDAIFFLEGKEFRYYIAGYLLAALELNPCDTDLHSNLLPVFTMVGKEKDYYSHKRMLMRLLTRAQLRAVHLVFDELRNRRSPCLDDLSIQLAMESLSFHQK